MELPFYFSLFSRFSILIFNSLIASINRALKLPYATDLIPVLASVSTTSGSTFSTAWAITPACLLVFSGLSNLTKVTPSIWLSLLTAFLITFTSPLSLASENAWISFEAYIDTPLTLAFTWKGYDGEVVLKPNLLLVTSAYKNDTLCTWVALTVLTK